MQSGANDEFIVYYCTVITEAPYVNSALFSLRPEILPSPWVKWFIVKTPVKINENDEGRNVVIVFELLLMF